jgi:outer membrane protein OmpA-like peptidoglycan-associated protein
MAPSRRKTHVWWGLALLIGALALSPPAGAGDTPSLQDFLGRAQTQTERKAVEDLVEKLQGAARKPAPSTPAPAPAPASTTAAPVPEAAKLPEPTASPAPPPAAPPEKSASPATITPQAAVESAEKKQRPSVDLEVFFDYDAARITPQAASVLTTLGRALVDARLADDAFLIAGHTDAKGGDDYNLALSERRAEAVRQFLIDNFKIEPAKLVAKGFGRQRLKNPKLPLAGENRRVQIVNLSK